MRVVHNGLFLTRPHTGVGQYTANLLRALIETSPGTVHVAVVPEAVSVDIPGLSLEVVTPSRRFGGRGLVLDKWESVDVGQAARKLDADVFYSSYPTPPVRTPIPVVMTVHDVIPWELPAYRSSLRKRIKLAKQTRGIRAATQLVTVSQTTAVRISAVLGVPPERVHVAYEDTDPRYHEPPSDTAVAQTRAHYGLARPYLLYLGGFDPRKQVPLLLEAFAESKLGETHDLVVLGAATADPLYADYRRIPDLLQKLQISSFVKLPGFVPEDDKHHLLAGAAAFAYPSRAEGFGLPILEALRLGVPTVAAAIPTVQELFGDAVRQFPPDNRTALATELRSILTHPRGVPELVRRYSWKATARKVSEALRQAT